MTWLLPLITKIVWWAAPKLLQLVTDQFELCLTLVAQAQTDYADPENRRNFVLSRMTAAQYLPETVQRILIEACVILLGLGVTPDALAAMENNVASVWSAPGASEDKRMAALNAFLTSFPDVPERAARLLLQIAYVKVSALFAGTRPAGAPAATGTNDGAGI